MKTRSMFAFAGTVLICLMVVAPACKKETPPPAPAGENQTSANT
jgi:hypothetical protein